MKTDKIRESSLLWPKECLIQRKCVSSVSLGDCLLQSGCAASMMCRIQIIIVRVCSHIQLCTTVCTVFVGTGLILTFKWFVIICRV